MCYLESRIPEGRSSELDVLGSLEIGIEHKKTTSIFQRLCRRLNARQIAWIRAGFAIFGYMLFWPGWFYPMFHFDLFVFGHQLVNDEASTFEFVGDLWNKKGGQRAACIVAIYAFVVPCVKIVCTMILLFFPSKEKGRTAEFLAVLGKYAMVDTAVWCVVIGPCLALGGNFEVFRGLQFYVAACILSLVSSLEALFSQGHPDPKPKGTDRRILNFLFAAYLFCLALGYTRPVCTVSLNPDEIPLMLSLLNLSETLSYNDSIAAVWQRPEINARWLVIVTLLTTILLPTLEMCLLVYRANSGRDFHVPFTKRSLTYWIQYASHLDVLSVASVMLWACCDGFTQMKPEMGEAVVWMFLAAVMQVAARNLA